MATYATTSALQLVMTGVNFSATNMQTLASKAIDHAEAEVNKHLSKRYDLSAAYFQTTTSVPPLVRTLTEQYAEGQMWKWISRGSKESVDRGTAMIDGAIKNLEAIRDYKADLYDTLGSVISDFSNTAYRVHCSTTDYAPTANEDDELSWKVDSDKLNAIATERD